MSMIVIMTMITIQNHAQYHDDQFLYLSVIKALRALSALPPAGFVHKKMFACHINVGFSRFPLLILASRGPRVSRRTCSDHPARSRLCGQPLLLLRQIQWHLVRLAPRLARPTYPVALAFLDQVMDGFGSFFIGKLLARPTLSCFVFFFLGQRRWEQLVLVKPTTPSVRIVIYCG